jgi:hypothetical protein
MTIHLSEHETVTPMQLRSALEESWTPETSSDGKHWTPNNPAWGQCAVTALVVQDFLGGDLLRSVVQEVSHYWNRLPTGEEIDLTRVQFGIGISVPPGEERSREHVLSFPETRYRYRALRHEVMSRLARSSS